MQCEFVKASQIDKVVQFRGDMRNVSKTSKDFGGFMKASELPNQELSKEKLKFKMGGFQKASQIQMKSVSNNDAFKGKG